MRIVIKISLIISLLAPFISGAEEFTLDRCLQTAYERNLDIRQKVLDLQKFEAKVSQAYSGVFPSISVTSGASFIIEPTRASSSMTNPATGDLMSVSYDNFDYGFQHALQIQQVLFSGQAFMGIKIAGAQRDLEQMNYELLKRNIKSQIEQAFYAIIMTQKVVEIAQASYSQDTSHLRISEEKLKNGLASEFEVLRTSVKVSASRSELENAKLSNRLAQLYMFALLDMSFAEDAKFAGDFAKPTGIPPLDEALKMAKENRLELKIISRSVESFGYLVNLYRASYLPGIVAQGKFSFAGASNQFGDYVAFDDFKKDWTVALGLQWTLFDGLNREAKIHETKTDLEKLKLQSEQILLGISFEINQAYWQLAQYELDYNAALSSIEEAQKMLDIANVQYQGGLITFVELNDAQLAFDATNLLYYKSLFNYNNALSKFNRAIGR